MADHLGIRLHEIEIRPDIVDLLPRMVDILDEPIGDPAAINTLLMCDAAREAGVKVLLSGMGADELFGGYRKHLAMLRRRALPPAAAAVRPGRHRAGRARPPGRGRWTRPAHASAGLSGSSTFAELPEQEAFRRSYTLYDPDELAGLLDPALAQPRRHGARPAPGGLRGQRRSTTWSAGCAWPTPGCSCRASTSPTPTGRAWPRPPRCACPSSTRWSCPRPSRCRAAAKIRGRQQKAALKDAARAWLPDEVIDRPKASFGAPLRAWVTNDLRELVDDVLLRGELVASGFLRPAPLERLVGDQRSGRRDRSKQVWQLLSLELWYRNARAGGVRAP